MKSNFWQDLADSTGNSRIGEEITTAEQFFKAVMRTLIIPLLIFALSGFAFVAIVFFAGLGAVSGPFGSYNGVMAAVFAAVATVVLISLTNGAAREARERGERQ